MRDSVVTQRVLLNTRGENVNNLWFSVYSPTHRAKVLLVLSAVLLFFGVNQCVSSSAYSMDCTPSVEIFLAQS